MQEPEDKTKSPAVPVEPIGPKVMELIIHKYTLLAIPPGTPHPFAKAVEVLRSGQRAELMKEARDWVRDVLLVLRQATDPNPWRTATDEEISTEILRVVRLKAEEKRKNAGAAND